MTRVSRKTEMRENEAKGENEARREIGFSTQRRKGKSEGTNE